jgi:FkbM family methyltransferase
MRLTKEGIAVVEGDSHLSLWIEQHKTLEVAEGFCRSMSKYIPKGGAVLDIGACLGDHTATYSRMVGQKGIVHAFEPNPLAHECLAFNMKRYPNVTVHAVALGDKEETAHIESQGANLGATQLRPGGDVKVVTLDYYLKDLTKLHYVKIDAEGYEPKIIRGAMKTFARFRPVIVVEVNRPCLAAQGFQDADIFIPLRSLGYRFKPAEPHGQMDAVQVDVLCLPEGS